MKAFITILILFSTVYTAQAAKNTGVNPVEMVQKTGEAQIRNLIDPLLERYCHEECKLMGVNVAVDVNTADNVAPGFDEVDPRSMTQLAPSLGTVKILIDEKVGPVSRSKLLDLVHQYLDTLDYPVKVETQITRFPQPVGSAAKVSELREKITKQFKTTLEDLFKQFCPYHCLLADYELKTEVVNPEESQYGSTGEFVDDGSGVSVRIRDIAATVLVDETMTPEEQENIIEMAKLKTNFFKNVTLTQRTMKFPRPRRIVNPQGETEEMVGLDEKGRPIYRRVSSINSDNRSTESNELTTTNENQSNSQTNNRTNNKEVNRTTASDKSTSQDQREEKFSRIEKIERVESGDAVQVELQKFKVWGLILAAIILAGLTTLVFLMLPSRRGSAANWMGQIFQRGNRDTSNEEGGTHIPQSAAPAPAPITDRSKLAGKRYEAERIYDELLTLFTEHPRVAKHVFTRVLTEQGVETTAHYMQIFGDSIVVEMLRDPSLQSDLNQLLEFYAKNPVDIADDDRLDLLKKLHNRAIAGKLAVMGSRSSHLFEFLADMDGLQILELIRNESMTVKSIALTQCDSQKRQQIYAQLDEDTRMKLLAELSRIDYLPRDYINNVAAALKRKRKENPKLNTEALPGSEVLLTLLEKTKADVQQNVMKSLEHSNPESARMIRGKLVSTETLKYLRDSQLLEVILSLRHDELLQFLKGTTEELRGVIFQKAPRDLVADLQEELAQNITVSRELYQTIERKLLNRMKIMANEGLLNLTETNERMMASAPERTQFNTVGELTQAHSEHLRKAAGW